MRGQIPWARVIVVSPVVLLFALGFQSLGVGGEGKLRLFMRLAGTQIERGVPDTRVDAWGDILRRIPEHLWIGHGPAYSTEGSQLSSFVWPHSAYLFYLYTTGILGLVAWLWILGKLAWITLPGWRVDFKNASLATATRAVVHVQLFIFAVAQSRSDHQRGNVYLYVMWILFALAVIATRLYREQRQARRAAHSAA
jgi:O-antigen ligase